jgi:hypothetical protein
VKKDSNIAGTNTVDTTHKAAVMPLPATTQQELIATYPAHKALIQALTIN